MNVFFDFRRPKRVDRPPDETAEHFKSSSELNLSTASTSVPIRTTRASRLRAAAAYSDTSPSPRKSNRSSSVQSLLDDSKTKTKTSKILDRDKRPNRRQSNEKANAKKSTIYDIGATKTKSKHSISKNILEKDKSSFIATSPKYDEKLSSISKSSTNENKKANEDIHIHVNGVEFFDDIVGDNSLEKEKIDDLFNNLVVNGVELKIDEDEPTGLGDGKVKPDFANEAIVDCNVVKVVDSVVPKVEDVGGLLGAVCVRKVERFSELLSNLCSPREADLLFEDILVENGINGESTPVSLKATRFFTGVGKKRVRARIHLFYVGHK